MRVAAVLTLFVVCAACSDKAKPAVAPLSSASSSAAPACARPHPSGQSSEAFEFQGHSRTYELYVPPVYDGAREVPSVLLTPVAVTKDNIKDMVLADGFVKREELCAGKFAADCTKAGI